MLRGGGGGLECNYQGWEEGIPLQNSESYRNVFFYVFVRERQDLFTLLMFERDYHFRIIERLVDKSGSLSAEFKVYWTLFPKEGL
jgi:hypothetical protein